MGALGETDLAERAGHHGQCQRAGSEVLRLGQHARGDEAALDDRVLYPRHHHVDAGGAQAAAERRIAFDVGCGQRPLETVGLLAFQGDPVDHEAGCFVPGQPLWCGHRCVLQTCIGPGFKLLAQGAFALLLAKQLLIGGGQLLGMHRRADQCDGGGQRGQRGQRGQEQGAPGSAIHTGASRGG